jgi:hypothetical protein
MRSSARLDLEADPYRASTHNKGIMNGGTQHHRDWQRLASHRGRRPRVGRKKRILPTACHMATRWRNQGQRRARGGHGDPWPWESWAARWAYPAAQLALRRWHLAGDLGRLAACTLASNLALRAEPRGFRKAHGVACSPLAVSVGAEVTRWNVLQPT